MIVVTCGKCQSRIKAKPEYAGRKVKCPKCQGPVAIPQAEVVEPKPQLTVPSETTAESQPGNQEAAQTPHIGDEISEPPAFSPPDVANDVPASFPNLSAPAGAEEAPTFPSPVEVGEGVGDVVVSAGGGESVSYARKKSGGGGGAGVYCAGVGASVWSRGGGSLVAWLLQR